MSSMYLYKRPPANTVKVFNNIDGIRTYEGDVSISAYVGIDAAIRGVAMGNGTLPDALRILRKIEQVAHPAKPELDYEYIIFTEKEKNLVIAACNQFDWSKYAISTGNTVWVRWLDFLAGFDPEDENFNNVWTKYDPMRPSLSFLESQKKIDADRASYEESLRVAANMATSTTPTTPTMTEGATEGQPLEENITPRDEIDVPVSNVFGSE